jgi:hypothetical protein
MHNLEVPVILNEDPFVGQRPPSLEQRHVDSYSGEISVREAVYSQQNPGYYTPNGGYTYTSTTETRELQANNAQVKAFEKLGGYKNRAITGISVDVTSMNLNLLFGMVQRIDILLNGSVMEYGGHQGSPALADGQGQEQEQGEEGQP